MASSTDVIACVAGLLAQRLEVVELERRIFPAGSGVMPSVVNSYRLLLVRKGIVDYALEDWRGQVWAGELLLVPAWMKRGWRAGERTAVDLEWIAFNPVAETIFPDRPFHWKSDQPPRESESLTRMQKVWEGKPPTGAKALFLEGELKALLGRLAMGCTGVVTETALAPAVPPMVREITGVEQWIEQHYARPDVLDRAIGLIRSSDHYFRTRFRERTGFTLGQYVAMVRMRRARYLLSASATPVKDVAWQVGFRDPLHFSRSYRKFWGHPPKVDRR